ACQAMRTEQLGQAPMVDRVDRRPWPFAAVDLVHAGAIAGLPLAEKSLAVDAGAEHGQLVQDARAPVDESAVGVERERADRARHRRMINALPVGGIAQPRFIAISASLTCRHFPGA